MSHKKLPVGPNFVILTPERHDPYFALFSRQLADAVAVQSGAVDQEIRFKLTGGRLDAPSGGCRTQGRDSGAGDHASTLARNLFQQHLADPRVIDDAFLRHVQRRHTARVRFDFPHLLRL